jgi:hypothetical protein
MPGAQEYSAKTAWLAETTGMEGQAQVSGFTLACGCCTFVTGCVFAWGVLGTVYCISDIVHMVLAGA